MDLAAHWAGFTTVQFVENNEFCQKVLAKNFPGVPIHGDINTFDATQFRGISLLSGGYPCQDISCAGKQAGLQGERSGLWFRMLEVIAQARPSWVVAENVAALIGMGIDTCLLGLENEGYSARTVMVPACGVGAPHRRYRVFIVAKNVGDTSSLRRQWNTERECGGKTQKRWVSELEPGSVNANASGIAEPQKNQATCAIGSQWNAQNDVDSGGGSDVAYAEKFGRNEAPTSASGEYQRERQGPFGRCDSVASDAKGKQGYAGGYKPGSQAPQPGDSSCSGYGSRTHWALPEPDMGRVVDGPTKRLDRHFNERLKALGNMVMPQQVVPIFDAIAKELRSA